MKMKCLFVLLGVIIFACHSKKAETLTIATAANVQFAMKALIEVFEGETGIPTRMVLGSSGKLTAQIKEGAPYDVFVSADMKFPEALYKSGLTTNIPEIYGYGILVLWTTSDSIQTTFEELIEKKVRHIAIANPKTAPYGKAAVESLTNLGLYESVKEKLVYGESVSQVNQFLLSKAAEIGFTSKSVVVSEQLKNAGKWHEVDTLTYAKIAQGAVVIQGAHTESAEKFYAFLFSDHAKEIFKRYGYKVE